MRWTWEIRLHMAISPRSCFWQVRYGCMHLLSDFLYVFWALRQPHSAQDIITTGLQGFWSLQAALAEISWWEGVTADWAEHDPNFNSDSQYIQYPNNVSVISGDKANTLKAWKLLCSMLTVHKSLPGSKKDHDLLAYRTHCKEWKASMAELVCT